MIKALLLTTILVTAACSKKEDKGAAPAADPKATGAEPAKPGAAPAAPAAPAAGKFTCDTILSKAIRDKYFAGYTIENVDFPVKHAGKCKLTTPDGSKEFELDAACASFMKNAKDQMVEALKKQFPDFKDVPGAGDLTIARDMGPEIGLLQFTAWNKGSFCQAGSTIPTSIDTTAFLTEWLASLPTG